MDEPNERVEKLLAMILLTNLKDEAPGERALALNRAGFLPAEIAQLLGERANTVAVQILRAKKASKKKARGKRK